MAHNWDKKMPATCARCGAGKVMERAVIEEWVKPPADGGPDIWKSSGHRELVMLCDNQCYADMGYDEVKQHKEDILAMCEKIGWKPRK